MKSKIYNYKMKLKLIAINYHSRSDFYEDKSDHSQQYNI